MEMERGTFTGRDSHGDAHRVYRMGSGSAIVLEDKGRVGMELGKWKGGGGEGVEQ
jgi:hypothetical protein